MVRRLLDIIEIKVLTHVAGGAGRSGCGWGWGLCPKVVEARRWRSSLKHRGGKNMEITTKI